MIIVVVESEKPTMVPEKMVLYEVDPGTDTNVQHYTERFD
jgi:hypothetical protein